MRGAEIEVWCDHHVPFLNPFSVAELDKGHAYPLFEGGATSSGPGSGVSDPASGDRGAAASSENAGSGVSDPASGVKDGDPASGGDIESEISDLAFVRDPSDVPNADGAAARAPSDDILDRIDADGSGDSVPAPPAPHPVGRSVIDTDHLLTHKPARKDGQACMAGKAKHKQCRRKVNPTPTKFKKFGEMVTMDHIVARGRSASFAGHEAALVVYDLGTSFKMTYPHAPKTTPPLNYH